MKLSIKRNIVLLIVLVLAGVSLSCSDDDDENSVDPIVGTWSYYRLFKNDEEVPLENCENIETSVFMNNGNIEITPYREDLNNNCILEDNILGSWENQGNNFYALTFYGETNTDEIIFENNTFFVIDTYTDQGITYTEKYVYIKN